MDSHHNRKPAALGVTIVEVFIIVLAILVLALFALVLLNSRHRQRMAGAVRDAAQIRGIQQSWTIFAREFGGEMPTPSMMIRLTADGIETTQRGSEDVTLNTTANLHSVAIMQNYYTSEMCVSPTEPNPKVKALAGDDYNYNVYKPAASTYWDSTFTANLQTGSNVSYASMPIHGQLRAKHWKQTASATWPIIGNRGPINGVHDPNSFTLRIHPPFDQWSGNICFADSHFEFVTGLPTGTTAGGSTMNTQGLFRYDGEEDSDGILTFTKSMSRDGPVIQHD